MSLALKRGIQNWERSGQGDGGFTEQDEIVLDASEEEKDKNNDDNELDEGTGRFGSLKQRPRRALDNRSNFFDGRSTYLLYMWDMLDEHGLLQSSVQQLHDGIGSGDGGESVPFAITGKRKSVDDYSAVLSKMTSATKSQFGSSIEKHCESIVFLARTVAAEHEKGRLDTRRNNIISRINTLRDSKRNMALHLADPSVATNQPVMDILLAEMKGIVDEIEENKDELNAIATTLKKNNQTPLGI